MGPYLDPKKIIHLNIKRVIPDIDNENLKKLTRLMWNNYGRVFAEYVFIKEFRAGSLASNIEVEGKEIIKEIINNNQQVVFVSGHLSNFELMAMELEKAGINLSAIYRPLNNVFLNPLIERIRKNIFVKIKLKKGLVE